MLDRFLERLPAEPRRTLVLLGVIALAAALFRFPGLGYSRRGVLRRGVPRKDGAAVPARRAAHRVGPPPDREAPDRGRRGALRLRAWAWRLAPALAGTLLAPVFFLLARRVLATERAALFATLLLLLDGVYLVQSRVAMTNVFAVLFQLLSALLLVRAASRRGAAWADGGGGPGARARALDALDEPLRLGLPGPRLPGAAPRRGPSAGASCARRPCLRARPRRRLPAELPALDAAGPPGVGSGRAAGGDLELPREPHATHTYFSPWWTWPWLYRPTWYFWWSGAGVVRGIVALGNPAIWWVWPLSAWAIARRALARPPAPLRGGGVLPPLPPLGALAPHPQLQPLPLRGDPLRLPCARLAARSRLGRQGARSSRGATCSWSPLFLLFLPFLTAMPSPPALGLPLPGRRRDLDLVPELDLTSGSRRWRLTVRRLTRPRSGGSKGGAARRGSEATGGERSPIHSGVSERGSKEGPAHHFARDLHRRLPRPDGTRDGAGPRDGRAAHQGRAHRALVRLPADVPRLHRPGVPVRLGVRRRGFRARPCRCGRARDAPAGCCSCSGSATSCTCPMLRSGRRSGTRRPGRAGRPLRLRRPPGDRRHAAPRAPAAVGGGSPLDTVAASPRPGRDRVSPLVWVSGVAAAARGDRPLSTTARARAFPSSRSPRSCWQGRWPGRRSAGRSRRRATGALSVGARSVALGVVLTPVLAGWVDFWGASPAYVFWPRRAAAPPAPGRGRRRTHACRA